MKQLVAIVYTQKRTGLHTGQPQPQIRLPSRSETASYANWQYQVAAWERREQYRRDWMGQPTAVAAEAMGVTERTIQRWWAAIVSGEHRHPGRWYPPG